MTKDLIPIHRALISVTDKAGLADFARELQELIPSIEIIASGGTASTLEQNNITYTPLNEYTGFPECFGGRVKTLHPFIAGGILMRRGIDDDEAQKMGIGPIDLIVCNLYDFAKASSEKKLSINEMIESMDIGGSTLIRSGCKNYQDVVILVNPLDYPLILEEIKRNSGQVSLATRQKLAVKGINISADYEALLAKVLSKQLSDEETHRPKLRQGKQLRYGENPDQEAWVYSFEEENGITKAKILSGKELSYNNYEDATVAYNAAQELLELDAAYGVAIIKHGSLCAYAAGKSLGNAFDLAWEGDSKSAFGSVVALTSPITTVMVDKIKNKFIEVLIAPKFEQAFVDWAKQNKPNLRLLEFPNRCTNPYQYKNISGGMLVQTRQKSLFPSSFEKLFVPCDSKSKKRIGIVTHRHPLKEQKELYAFGIAAVNFAKSNAVAIVREPKPGTYQLIGMGAGQPNRVDSLERLAIPKAIENLQSENNFDPHYNPQKDLANCVIASDGFFPFDDSIRYAAKFGIINCIQPGGSMRDQEVIDAANELDLCMIFTGKRYFYH